MHQPLKNILIRETLLIDHGINTTFFLIISSDYGIKERINRKKSSLKKIVGTASHWHSVINRSREFQRVKSNKVLKINKNIDILK